MSEAYGAINSVMTAWYSVVDVARLERGEKILIHGRRGSEGDVRVRGSLREVRRDRES